MRIACIGSRALNEGDLHTCFQLGEFIANQGGEIHSGNAEGADQAFANGANTVDPERVHLHLPWASFNHSAVVAGNVAHLPVEGSGFEMTAAKYHPRWKYLKQGARKLHIRNVSIVVWPCVKDLVLAFPSQKAGGGGTGQGIRIATGLGIEVIDLNGLTREDLSNLCERLRTLRSKV